MKKDMARKALAQPGKGKAYVEINKVPASPVAK